MFSRSSCVRSSFIMKTFYWYFRPIAVVLKIFGVFPIQNVTTLDTSCLQFRYFSGSFLYSIIIFSFYISIIYFFSKVIFYKPVTEYLTYVVCLMTGRSIMCFLFCYHKHRKLPRLIRLLDTFDQKKYKILIISTRKYKIFFQIISNSAAIASLAFLLYQSSELIKKTLPPDIREKHIGLAASCFFSFLTTWQLYPSFLYIYFAVKISYSFQEINNTLIQRNFMHNYFSTSAIKYDSDMYQTIADIRILHNMLSECVHELGKCYGSYMAVDNLCMIVIFVLNISVFVYKSNHDSHLLLVTLGNAVIFLNTIYKSEALKDNVSNKLP